MAFCGARSRPAASRCALAAVAALAFWSATARAEVYRCVDAQGRERFVGSPHACPGARPHTSRGRLERVPAPAPDGSPAAAATATATGRASHSAAALAALLPSAAEVVREWEVVEEAPARPERDPDLVRWGVVAQVTRHYTRAAAGNEAQVCSIELWGFRSLEQARAADAGFAFPGWTIRREGAVLVMTRGLRKRREGAAQRGVFPACERLGEQVQARAAADAAAAGAAGDAPDPADAPKQGGAR